MDGSCLDAPELNEDISGPGVRISFYLQALFLSLLSARSGSLEQITGALYTLVATNIALVVTSFILGFKTNPSMSLQDAIVVFYLLSLSWVSVFTSMPAYNRFVRSDKTLQLVSMIQSYLIFTFIFAVLVKAHSFGSTPGCNSDAVAVIFKQFRALDGGRIAASIVLSIIIVIYTFLTFTDYQHSIERRYRNCRGWAWRGRNWVLNRRERFSRELGGLLGCMKPRKASSHGPSIHNRESMALSATGVQRMSTNTSTSSYQADAHLDKDAKAQDKKDKKEKRKARKHKLGSKHNYLDPDSPTRSSNNKSNTNDENHNNDTTHTHRNNNSNPNNPKQYDAGIFGTLLIQLIVIFTFWALFVLNTELLVRSNSPGGDDDGRSLWQFGQILPMFLIVLPLVNLIKVFRVHRLSRRFHRRRVHRRRTRAKRRAAAAAAARASGFHTGSGLGAGVDDDRTESFGGIGQTGGTYGRSNNFFGSGGRFDIPFFFSHAFRGTETTAGLGNQPSAHISLQSIHSTIANSITAGRDEPGSGGGQEGPRRRLDSGSSSGSSSSSASSSSDARRRE
ncbi:uncharacterized protein FOMMEDRAFT_167676 [Fomitiporia mediterranea MF3/22]|uniref:uncharacterized protein n=1 Tax=Fomitiporia mediterranea (strain MF3/22) TaxID=694068 RepID=UPI00044090DF|nr:uncharacterized protein FOMMEDRAFT_167676 [Fomitiporia mediterranea MF3/22]EJD04506.1 hypothetical protein FOMMEDRAFT_167676 [Fomitiporia mediterranea MF3/22]